MLARLAKTVSRAEVVTPQFVSDFMSGAGHGQRMPHAATSFQCILLFTGAGVSQVSSQTLSLLFRYCLSAARMQLWHAHRPMSPNVIPLAYGYL